MKTVQAVFEGGVFRPIAPVDLPEHSKVEFVPRLIDQEVAEQLEQLRQTDPDLAETRARTLFNAITDSTDGVLPWIQGHW